MRKLAFVVPSAVLVTGTLLGCASQTAGPVAVPSRPDEGWGSALAFDRDIAPILDQYCVGCHSGPDAPEGVVLRFASEEEARQKAATADEFWDRVSRNVASGQMPPSYAERRPDDRERRILVDWIAANVLTPNGLPDPGPFMVRRLNNREYENTVRDLLFLPDDVEIAADFPADERGEGFDNNASTLTISPLLIERYLAAAEQATIEALALDRDAKLYPTLRDPTQPAIFPSLSRLNDPSKGIRPDFTQPLLPRIRLNLEAFAPRAFRRPVTDTEIDELLNFAALAFSHEGEAIDPATALAIRAALMSPKFLFKVETDPNPDGTGKVYQLTEYQLASRLSYFLWSTMPDDSLFLAARQGTLRSNLDAEIERMLRHPRSVSLTRDFLGQWLEIRGLSEVANVPGALLEEMKSETEHFFDYIVREDRSIMEFLDSDYAFLNENLSRHYGIEGVTGPDFRKVEIDRARRGGIFTQASFLTLTSKPLGTGMRTSPVVRGKWILENIFNETIPPPPPNVPSLNLEQGELKGTVRQIFEQHRADPVCAGCHARMDPYGFALENYDGTGVWRDEDNGAPVDASGEIGGRTFDTPLEFRRMLAGRQDDFRVALVRKLLSYALGRSILPSDRATVEQIAAAVRADGDRFSSVIRNIARSYPFQYARGTPSTTAAPSPPGEPVRLYHPGPAAADSLARPAGASQPPAASPTNAPVVATPSAALPAPAGGGAQPSSPAPR